MIALGVLHAVTTIFVFFFLSIQDEDGRIIEVVHICFTLARKALSIEPVSVCRSVGQVVQTVIIQREVRIQTPHQMDMLIKHNAAQSNARKFWGLRCGCKQ